MDLASWNAMTFGNIGITALLFLVRSLYMIGALRRDRVQHSVERKSR